MVSSAKGIPQRNQRNLNGKGELQSKTDLTLIRLAKGLYRGKGVIGAAILGSSLIRTELVDLSDGRHRPNISSALTPRDVQPCKA